MARPLSMDSHGQRTIRPPAGLCSHLRLAGENPDEYGKADSLNVAVSCAVLLYEVFNQRRRMG